MAGKRVVANRGLTVFLVKQGITDPSEILADPDSLILHTFGRLGLSRAVLYVQPRIPLAPRWVSFFEASSIPPLSLQTSGASAILLLPRKDRVFALAFGYGRHLLRPGRYEENFGLKATLNSIHPDRIHTIDRETFEATSRHTREQASKATDLSGFGINVDYDLLHAVAGTPTSTALGSLMAGRDSLSVTVKITIDKLPELLDEFLRRSSQTTYRSSFPWVDHIRDIRDPDRIQILNDALVASIATGKHEKIWLAIPEIVDWNRIDGFRYGTSRRGETAQDLHLSDYLAYREPDTPTLEHLKRDQVRAIDPITDDIAYRWTVYQCLYAEITDQDKTLLLSNGHWYEVERSYVRRVNRDIAAIRNASFCFPEYTDASEKQYNQRVARIIPKATCLDGKLIQHGGHPSSIECCDVYVNRCLIHMKRYAGSGVLSHLFSQGFVAASLLQRDPDFRAKVNEYLPTRDRLRKPKDAITPSDYEIIFGIISRSATKETLPFFSRVTLRKVAGDLQALGFRVSVAMVHDATQP